MNDYNTTLMNLALVNKELLQGLRIRVQCDPHIHHGNAGIQEVTLNGIVEFWHNCHECMAIRGDWKDLIWIFACKNREVTDCQYQDTVIEICDE